MERINDACKSFVIHEDRINKVEKNMPGEELLYDLAEFFKVFGDATRVKILFALLFSEMCVCDLSVLLHMNQSAVSHQLRILKQARLVKYRREGKVVYYSLKDRHVENIFEQGFIHLKEDRPSQQESADLTFTIHENPQVLKYQEERKHVKQPTNPPSAQPHKEGI